MSIAIKNWPVWAMMAFFIAGCNSGDDQPDAFGNFETREIIVSSQLQGTLENFGIREGTVVEKGLIVGRIDSAVPWLKKQQLLAQQLVINSKLSNVDAQLNVQKEQISNLQKEVKRIESLRRENAATEQQWDDITGKLRVLEAQTEAIQSQKKMVHGEQAVLNAQLAEIENQLSKCRIISPANGTVLEVYADEGELVTPGKALFKVGDLTQMELKVYISGSQLSSIAIGDSVTVRIDGPGESLHHLRGLVSWVSSQAEFTPKIIQTRDERVNMVYAVKILVTNDGKIKIGMPGEVIWRESAISNQ